MAQPWIDKPKTDGFFILAPSFLVIAIVFLFHDALKVIETKHSFYTWLFLIVFIDVAHVYATLFKTYFVREKCKKRRKLLVALPIVCFVIGIILFSFGSVVFWSVLAYIAVFHFIRQQYGFMRLYSRKEVKTYWSVAIDNLIIYTATVYPMLYWFFSSPRAFNWFTEKDFIRFENQVVLGVLGWFYGLIIVFYIVRTVYKSTKEQYFNIPKNAIITGTFFSWYFGIVYFNNDLVFTLLNVVSHGIPYIALIYLNEIDKKSEADLGVLNYLKGARGFFVFMAFLSTIAFFEEYVWEVFVWNEQFSWNNSDFSNWQLLLVPLFTVPQFTHYLLDGFIWKSK
ncbi:hypothetical protein [Flavobacterium sp. DSP2-3-1]|uniref:hypothetical protein n=1 Tax=Flavobacterium sp. DSP2-3-1 TaxID=2804620 RepID=UPI003CEAAF12